MPKRSTPKNRLNQWWLHYEYKHTTIAIAALVTFVALLDSAFFRSIFDVLVSTHYVGALVAGVLSASFFTAAPALVLVVDLASKLDPLNLALIVGIGSAIGDMLLLLFFEERIFHELRPLFSRWLNKQPRARKKRRPSAPLLLLGALIITTPLPDEVGLSLLGISHFPKIVILVICLALNIMGAALLIFAVRAVGA